MESDHEEKDAKQRFPFKFASLVTFIFILSMLEIIHDIISGIILKQ